MLKGIIPYEFTPFDESKKVHLDGKFQPTSQIVRYMPLWKFEWLLKNGLYFRNIQKLDDNLEGTLSKRSEDFYSNHHPTYSQMKDHMFLTGDYSANTFVNCWHIGSAETEDMWGTYTEKNDGIVIVSSIEKLQSALEQSAFIKDLSGYCRIINIRYIDFESDLMDGYQRHWYKDKSFEHEKEVRASFSKTDVSEDGQYADIAVTDLIESIKLRPDSDDSYRNKVLTLIKEFGVPEPLLQ